MDDQLAPQGYGSAASPAGPLDAQIKPQPAIEQTEAEAEPVTALGAGLVEDVSGRPDAQAASDSTTPPETAAPDPLDLSQPLGSDQEDPAALETPAEAGSRVGPEEAGEGGGVRLILEDGTLAKPSLDPELEERLRYIVDNIVPPSSPPSDGPAT